MANLPFNYQSVPGAPSLLKPIGRGKVFFVDSNGGGSTTSGGLSPESAFTTLDSAINACTANQGDTIYVLPGHAETIGAANGFDADVAGIRIIGLGWGASRPTFTYSATGSTAAVGASSVQIENIRFVAGVSAIVKGLDIETGNTDCVLKNCEFYWGGTTGYDFVDSVIVQSASHRAIIEDCRFLAEPAVAGAATGVKVVGATHNCVVRRCEFMGDYSTACVNQTTPACAGLMFLDNIDIHIHDTVHLYHDINNSNNNGRLDL